MSGQETSLGPWRAPRLRSWSTHPDCSLGWAIGRWVKLLSKACHRTHASCASMRAVYSWSSAPGWLCYRWALRDRVCLCATGFRSGPRERRAPLGPNSQPRFGGLCGEALAERFVVSHWLCPFKSQGTEVCIQEDTMATGLLRCCLPLHCWHSRINLTFMQGAPGGCSGAVPPGPACSQSSAD